MAPWTSQPAGLAVVGLVGVFCVQSAWLWLMTGGPGSAEDVLRDVPPPEFAKHAEPYRESRIVKVTEGVYVAIGFGMVNSILLEGPDALVVVDTTISQSIAARIREEFRRISPKPIHAIIYTHFHPDHTYGVKSFIDDPEQPPDIWAHEEFLHQMQITANTGKIGFLRARKQFGIFLPDSVGAQVDLGFDRTFKSAPLFPNRLVREKRVAVTIGGIALELLHVPGETADHLAVFWPERGVVCTGDNIYQAFPNLYAIRGAPSRDVMKWADSLDVIRDLKPEYLVPSHTLPISGREEIDRTLTIYRDAIQYVHDQTVRHMNKGMHPDDIVPLVQLPPHMSQHPYLQPLYGTVPWSVRGVFDQYMGWFSGDATELSPLATLDKAEKLIKLAGGRKNVMKKAQQAYDQGDFQWALELTSSVFKVHPDYELARSLRSQCLKELSQQQTSSNGRSFYLTQAIEDYNFGVEEVNPREMVKIMPMEMLFKTMTTRVDAEKCGERNTRAIFIFTDTDEVFALHLRHGVMAILREVPETFDVRLITTSTVWREIVAKERSPISSYMAGDVTIEGGTMAFKSFMDCIERD